MKIIIWAQNHELQFIADARKFAANFFPHAKAVVRNPQAYKDIEFEPADIVIVGIEWPEVITKYQSRGAKAITDIRKEPDAQIELEREPATGKIIPLSAIDPAAKNKTQVGPIADMPSLLDALRGQREPLPGTVTYEHTHQSAGNPEMAHIHPASLEISQGLDGKITATVEGVMDAPKPQPKPKRVHRRKK